ncbi:MAG: hypothetical protein DRO88_12610 [Promethearchaeia archaeon]|nr:MAG: hypothetical protein DRO88_12610 [Candidatus Lokiarchaeia archaeon]
MNKISELKVELETKSPFRIGTKKLFSGIDQPIIRLGDKIVIPGTTLKGALRNEIERYLIQNCSNNPEMKSCIPTARLSVDEEKLVEDGKYRRSSCHYPCNMRKEKNQEKERCSSIKWKYYGLEDEKREGKHSICPTCYLLGAQGIPGFITVPFLNTEVKEEEFAGVRIDRGNGTVTKEGPRNYLIIPEDVKFTGTLTILLKDDIKGWELGKPRPLKEPTLGDKWLENSEWTTEKIIKELIKERLENIKVLGGLKSVGAGKVKITVTQL